MPKKYRLLQPDLIRRTTSNGEQLKLVGSRIQALVDIPLHNVKAGDLGGYVENQSCLSHDDSCWIGGDAYVGSLNREGLLGKIYPAVRGNALVTGTSVLIKSVVNQCAMVTENSYLKNSVASGYSFTAGGACLDKSGLYEYAVADGLVFIHYATITNSAAVTESAHVFASLIKDNANVWGKSKVMSSRIQRFSKVFGNASVMQSLVTDTSVISENATVMNSFIKDRADIKGYSKVNENCMIGGRSLLGGGTQIGSGCIVLNEILVDQIRNYNPDQGSRPVAVDLQNPALNLTAPALPGLDVPAVPLGLKAPLKRTSIKEGGNHELPMQNNPAAPAPQNLHQNIKILTDIIDVHKDTIKTKTVTPMNVELEGLREIVAGVEASYEAYTLDIVKLINYPLMADSSVPEVEDFIIALKNAKRILLGNNTQKASAAVEKLERAFLRAENKVCTARQSTVPEATRKSLHKAQQLLSLAINEASSDNEKRMGFKAGMKSLEGVLNISDQAVEAFKTRAGLLEIEA